MRKELGGPLGSVFSDFDERAFAAASIGQVHRATTVDGDEAVVKVQPPSADEVAYATRIVREDVVQAAAGRGSWSLDGRMIDVPVEVRSNFHVSQ